MVYEKVDLRNATGVYKSAKVLQTGRYVPSPINEKTLPMASTTLLYDQID